MIGEVPTRAQGTRRILLRVDEAAAALGLSRAKVYSLLAAKTFPVIHVGRSARIPVQALQDFVDEQIEEWRRAN